jgi:acetylornithine deacetylase/succinyl-diaminopimelate desuccinylase-like protein
MCHKPDEYIEIEQLEKAKEAYKRIILECLS